MGDNLTKMEFACSMDLKGAIPRARVNALLLPQLMRTPYDVQNYFLRVVPLAALTCDDARILADALFGIRSGPSMLLPAVTDRVAGRMKTYHALDELVMLYPSLPTLFAAVLRKKLRRPAPVTAHLSELTTDEAARIGDGLGMLSMTSPSAQVAVHEWLLQSEALREMQEQQPCIVPMVERMAELLLTLVGSDIKLRARCCRTWMCSRTRS
jgi:hypothetical protein